MHCYNLLETLFSNHISDSLSSNKLIFELPEKMIVKFIKAEQKHTAEAKGWEIYVCN